MTPNINNITRIECRYEFEEYIDVRTQPKETLYICKIEGCQKTFRFKSEIKRHMQIHSDYRPFQCTYHSCQKKFKRKDALENHIRTHTQEKPFECTHPNCNKRFTTKASLRYHSLKHQKGSKDTASEVSKEQYTDYQESESGRTDFLTEIFNNCNLGTTDKESVSQVQPQPSQQQQQQVPQQAQPKEEPKPEFISFSEFQNPVPLNQMLSQNKSLWEENQDLKKQLMEAQQTLLELKSKAPKENCCEPQNRFDYLFYENHEPQQKKETQPSTNNNNNTDCFIDDFKFEDELGGDKFWSY